MRIRTPSQFTDALDQNLSHRKRELSALYGAVIRCRSHEKQVLTKSALCILYAHWEGFVKFGGKCFANYVHHRGLSPHQLANGFLAAAVRDKLRELRGTRKVSLCREFVEMLRHPSANLPAFNWKQAVETHDNLSVEVLKEVLELVGCEAAYYEGRRGIIDDQLRRHRNSVAHTGFTEFDVNDYSGLHQSVIQLLERFRDDLENAVTTESFKVTGTTGHRSA